MLVFAVLFEIGPGDAYRVAPRHVVEQSPDDQVELVMLHRPHVLLLSAPVPFGLRAKLVRKLADEFDLDALRLTFGADDPRRVLDEPDAERAALHPIQCALGVAR